MNEENAIQISNVSKSFRVETIDPDKETTILKKIPTKIITHQVLKNINIEIKKGEVVGVIGRNGSGKSTLLSLISKIMNPDEGCIEYNGKISSILELGMGFHQDMSGRENIYLKGELYGFSKKEIDSKIDAIIEYSGIRAYIDNPVRTYSSGMSGRLAFAIMMNVESDIMVIDEVLSVGDAIFASKAREHFKNVASKGKTIVIVSHQTAALESMCSRVIWIENGTIHKDGKPKDVCAAYLREQEESFDITYSLAESGVSEAQYRLSIMYRDGEKTNKNEKLYKHWLSISAQQGYLKAQLEYADILLEEGKKEDAITYYQNASILGNLEAKTKISSLMQEQDNYISKIIALYEDIAKSEDGLWEYRFAELLSKTALTRADHEKAFDTFVKSAEHGYYQALHQIAIRYRDGIGVTKNYEKMVIYLNESSNKGNSTSATMLAEMYMQGKIIDKNENKAFELFLHAAKLGNQSAMFKVATHYAQGIGTEINPTLAKEWYNKYMIANILWHQRWAIDYAKCSPNCILPYEEIYANLSKINHSSYTLHKIDLETIAGDSNNIMDSLIEQLIEQIGTDSYRRIGNYYYEGVGVKRDFRESIVWYEKAASLGDTWCGNRLAEMYRDGKGCTQDLNKAIQYFEKCATQGNVQAICNLLSMHTAKLIDNPELFSHYFESLKTIGLSGNSDALKRIGNYYYEGVGVKRDFRESIVWYEKAASLGDTWCRNRLAEMYRDGKGCTQDIEKSIKWFTM